MKKFLLLGTIFVATGAFAFGGIGLGLKSSSQKAGVSAIGVHINGKGKADIDILEPCPEGLERNTDNTCTVCANGNVYLSYMDDPCGTDTPMNQTPCETGSDCYEGQGGETCCDNIKHVCKTGIYDADSDLVICPAENNKFCKSNKDCAQDEFCNIMSQGNTFVPASGTCLLLDEGVSYIYQGESYLGTLKPLTRWSAENWCKAHNRNVITLASLGIDKDNLGSNFNGCCYGDDCENINWEILEQVFPNNIPIWLADFWEDFGLKIRFESVSGICGDDDPGYCYEYMAICK